MRKRRHGSAGGCNLELTSRQKIESSVGTQYFHAVASWGPVHRGIHPERDRAACTGRQCLNGQIKHGVVAHIAPTNEHRIRALTGKGQCCVHVALMGRQQWCLAIGGACAATLWSESNLHRVGTVHRSIPVEQSVQTLQCFAARCETVRFQPQWIQSCLSQQAIPHLQRAFIGGRRRALPAGRAG